MWNFVIWMHAWNNVLDEHSDVTVICMDGTLFLLCMYVVMDGAMCWIHHMSVVHVKKNMYICV